MKFRSIAAFVAVVVTSASYAQAPATLPPPLPPATGAATPATGPLAPQGAPATMRTNPAAAEASAGQDAPSRWAAELDRLDADLRLRLLTASEPRTEWLAAEMDASDVEARVRHYTAARTAAPGERLYLASLGVACMQRMRPLLAPCDAVDRLADWARRDSDNGVPSLLLAGRARERGEEDLAMSFVEQAAGAARFDDYWSQGAARWWDYLRPLDVGVDPAAKAKAAVSYANQRELAWLAPLRSLCAEPAARIERMRSACAGLGQALVARSASFALRRAGARVAEVNARDPASRAAAQARHARVLAMTARCAQAQPDFVTALESPQAADRARAVEQFGAWASAQAQAGEVSACERAIASAPR